MDTPQIGTQVDMLRYSTEGDYFAAGVVVDRLTDPIHGLVLEVQFEDAKRMQRVWPTPAIRFRL